MLTDYSLKMPKEVYGGEHALEKLKDVMSVNDVKKVAVFTDHGIRGTGLWNFRCRCSRRRVWKR